MDKQQEASIFHHGIELFNSGQWFDAHEIWEDIWHIATGQHKMFYQGIIQCAVTLEHVRRGNPRGARNVYQTAQTKFRDLPDVYHGIPVKALLNDMATFLKPMLQMPPSAFSPGRGRTGINIPVNLDQAPNITLAYDPFADATQ